jgi:ABC-type branched-subunit amino acid transport system substrate-binding protein
MDGTVDLVIEDDESSADVLETRLSRVAERCDLLLGPYSTQLMKTAGRLAEGNGWLLWNQGGSGDDVETSHSGYVVSVLAPTSRYSEPFLRYLAANQGGAKLAIARGKGSFARQVASGAAKMASELDIEAMEMGPDGDLPSEEWDLFSVGVFEQDVDIVNRAQASSCPPRTVCAVAAGVREFADFVAETTNIFGIAQWFPGSTTVPELGPGESDFLNACARTGGAPPDYPAIQAVAGAIVAKHCAEQAGETDRRSLWAAAAALDTTTLYGGFRIDPITGAQTKHETVLVRWTADGLTLA